MLFNLILFSISASHVVEYQTSVMWSADYPELTVLLD